MTPQLTKTFSALSFTTINREIKVCRFFGVLTRRVFGNFPPFLVIFQLFFRSGNDKFPHIPLEIDISVLKQWADIPLTEKCVGSSLLKIIVS